MQDSNILVRVCIGILGKHLLLIRKEGGVRRFVGFVGRVEGVGRKDVRMWALDNSMMMVVVVVVR
jgi:hypothetical protein